MSKAVVCTGREREFAGDAEVTHVTVADGLTDIKQRAFAWCKGLTNLSFLKGSAVTTVGVQAFRESGIVTLQGMERVRKIGHCAFHKCEDLRTIEGLGCEEMGEGCFAMCSLLQSMKGWPASMTVIPAGTFQHCTAMTTVGCDISHVTSIGVDRWSFKHAFTDCTSLLPPSLSDGHADPAAVLAHLKRKAFLETPAGALTLAELDVEDAAKKGGKKKKKKASDKKGKGAQQAEADDAWAAQRLEKQRATAQRLEKQRATAQRLEKQRATAQRLEKQRATAQRLEKQRATAQTPVELVPSMSYYPKVRLGGPQQSVYLGVLKNGKKVAIKLQRCGATQSAEKEMEVLRGLSHPNVVMNMEFATTATDHVLALELCQGTVEDLSGRDLGKPAMLSLVQQTVEALDYLHDKGIAHRDLKPSNILYVEKRGKIQIKVADFGIAKLMDDDRTSYTATGSNADGSKGFQARELVLLKNLEEATAEEKAWRPTPDNFKRADIFALGLCLHFVLSKGGQHPFSDPKRAHRIPLREDRILDGEEPVLVLQDYEARELVLSCLKHDAKERPTAARLRAHPFFFSVDARLSEINKESRRIKASGASAELEAWCKDNSWRGRFADVWEGGEGKMNGNSYRGTGGELVRFLRNAVEHAADRSSEGTGLRRSVESLGAGAGDGAVCAWARLKMPELWVLIRA